jgi:hypothetical protein
MDIMVKALIAALFATIAIIGVGRASLKTNDLRNYPSLRPQTGPANGVPGADVDPNSAAAKAEANAAPAQGPMTQGEEAAAESGFSTELENPNK